MSEASSVTPPGIFRVERHGQTIIVVPLGDLRELEFQRIETGARDIFQILNAGVRNVVIDFEGTTYYGSTALGFFTKLWKRISRENGRMAFCNLSEMEREILGITMLDKLWPICSTRAEAIKAVGGEE